MNACCIARWRRNNAIIRANVVYTIRVLAALVEFPLANVETLAFKLLGIHREESVRLVNVWTKVEETEKKDD